MEPRREPPYAAGRECPACFIIPPPPPPALRYAAIFALSLLALACDAVDSGPARIVGTYTATLPEPGVTWTLDFTEGSDGALTVTRASDGAVGSGSHRHPIVEFNLDPYDPDCGEFEGTASDDASLITGKFRACPGVRFAMRIERDE